MHRCAAGATRGTGRTVGSTVWCLPVTLSFTLRVFPSVIRFLVKGNLVAWGLVITSCEEVPTGLLGFTLLRFAGHAVGATVLLLMVSDLILSDASLKRGNGVGECFHRGSIYGGRIR
jgi:hypothetical protein